MEDSVQGRRKGRSRRGPGSVVTRETGIITGEVRPQLHEDTPPSPIPAPENRYDAFLCYAREDGDFAVDQVRARLTSGVTIARRIGRK